MTPELLETFLDLVETRSFNRTAERLGVTQSTVSARVGALESALEVRLFSRSRAGTALTTEGLKFEPHARALRHAWSEARRSVDPAGTSALTLRIGIQNDLAAGHIGDWVMGFRRALPETAFYIELDYSAQMCADLETGKLDFAVLYSPRAGPDLHFTSVGHVEYRLVSSDGDKRSKLHLERYVRGSYSPAFDAAHRALLPDLSHAPLGAGQNSAVAGILEAMGGAGFVLAPTAAQLVASGEFRLVSDVQPISQPIFAATHLRHRTSALHRQLLRIVDRQLGRR
ncbi:MAG: LysR family transcriptional regulator [Cereibacter sphaeroides]|uniref:LysR family transcriptional regulator n=1 Tax=Cereibacter sphaeroides TaxID=1063 RepID=A0A2W5SK07_CERSP|nr:MAG: LysR family transcriptional regulator [Cereibacter sphaeroides]